MRFKVGDPVRDKVDGSQGVVSGVVGYFGKDEFIVEDDDTIYRARHAGVFYDVDIHGETHIVWEGRLVGRLPDNECYHPADISIDDLMRGLRETEHV